MSNKDHSYRDVKKSVNLTAGPTPDDGLTQSERFLQAAKEAGADADDPVAEALIGRMAKQIKAKTRIQVNSKK